MIAIILLTAASLCGTAGELTETKGSVVVKSISPILVVDAIEPSIPFWVDRLGFEKAAGVPIDGPDGDGPLGFAMFTSGDLTVMYQTRESIGSDLPALLGAESHSQILFVMVDDLDDVIGRIEGADVIVPERTTFYGMREIGVREPGGHAIVFAQQIEEEKVTTRR
jgi:uncharacterized glyoxalase superfamily protein PhnB